MDRLLEKFTLALRPPSRPECCIVVHRIRGECYYWRCARRGLFFPRCRYPPTGKRCDITHSRRGNRDPSQPLTAAPSEGANGAPEELLTSPSFSRGRHQICCQCVSPGCASCMRGRRDWSVQDGRK